MTKMPSPNLLNKNLEGGIPLRTVWDMPWVIGLELRRILVSPYIRLMFRQHGIRWGRGWRVWGMPIIQRYRGSDIHLGDRLNLRSWPAANPLAPNHPVVLATRTATAVIEVGEGVGMTGTTIVAAERVTLGNRVFMGANAVIVDTDFHPLDPETRQRDVLGGEHRPVVIEDDVFVGMNSLILKGVTIGAGAVVGAGSVVSRNVPPRTIVAGNPAQIIRSLQAPQGLRQ